MLVLHSNETINVIKARTGDFHVHWSSTALDAKTTDCLIHPVEMFEEKWFKKVLNYHDDLCLNKFWFVKV